jgi:hypothetical protein
MPIATERRQFYDSEIRVAAGLRSVWSMTKRFLSFARNRSARQFKASAAYGAEAAGWKSTWSRASLFRAPPCRFRIRLSSSLLRGRGRHAVAVVLDFRGVGLSAFSIMVVRQPRRGPERGGGGRLGIMISFFRRSAVGARPKLDGTSVRGTTFKDCVRTARVIFLSPLRASASAQWEGFGRLDSCKRSTSTSLTGTRSISAGRSTQPSA